MFQDQLVEVGILAGIEEQQSCRLFIGGVGKGTGRTDDGDVGRLATHVLRGLGTANHGVYQLAAVAAVHLDGQSQVLADGLKGADGQVLHGRDVALEGNVRYWRLMLGRGSREAHLAKREMFRQLHVGGDYWFHCK